MSMNFVETAISNFVSDFADNSQRKLGSKSLFANEKDSRMPEFLTFSEKEPQKRWQKTISSAAKSNSTLSLHLAAYEDDAHEIEKEQNCTPKFSKALPSFSDSLEFPRQQDDQVGEPEVMQFKSSQKVLNPNEASSAKNINKKSSGKEDKKGRKHHESPPNALMVYPMKELVFKGPFTDVVTSPLSIVNPTEQMIAFKTMNNAPKYYRCRPNIGYIRPGDTVELQVMVDPLKDERKIEPEKHKFMIQSAFVQENHVDESELPSAADFWSKHHSKRDIMVCKFAVAFQHQTFSTNGGSIGGTEESVHAMNVQVGGGRDGGKNAAVNPVQPSLHLESTQENDELEVEFSKGQTKMIQKAFVSFDGGMDWHESRNDDADDFSFEIESGDTFSMISD